MFLCRHFGCFLGGKRTSGWSNLWRVYPFPVNLLSTHTFAEYRCFWSSCLLNYCALWAVKNSWLLDDDWSWGKRANTFKWPNCDVKSFVCQQKACLLIPPAVVAIQIDCQEGPLPFFAHFISMHIHWENRSFLTQRFVLETRFSEVWSFLRVDCV
jgi:hypothetical protein